MIRDYLKGIQHIGIPTRHFEETKAFYEKLGFEAVHEPDPEKVGQRIMFLQLQDLVLEFYEDEETRRDGAINHIAMDCSDIEAALPCWKNGIRFFIFEGPNGERLEIDQKL